MCLASYQAPLANSAPCSTLCSRMPPGFANPGSVVWCCSKAITIDVPRFIMRPQFTSKPWLGLLHAPLDLSLLRVELGLCRCADLGDLLVQPLLLLRAN